MKLVKILNIKGAVLDKYQLENYLEKIASDHVLQEKSDKSTYPIPRLEDNFRYITKTYDILNKHLKMGINIHPAGEWLLDNYYIIEETVKTVQKELTLKKYTNFIGISGGAYDGFARIYVLATEIVAYTDSKIYSNNLEQLLRAYQTKKTLNMEEIWNIGIFLQIAIIENIRGICEKIYSSQIQKYKVENIIERLVEYKSKEEQKYKNNIETKNKITDSGQMKYPFIEYMSYRLKRYGRKAYNYLQILEDQVSKMGTSVSEVISKEHFDIAVKKVIIGNCIKSIKQIQRINFLEIFENINGVEELLKKDPANVYKHMDYKTKASYREKIKEISKQTKISEIYIANKALELSKQANEKNIETIEDNKKTHIGYYLISKGIYELYNGLQTNKKPKVNQHNNVLLYIMSVTIISIIITLLLVILAYKQTSILFGIITFILAFIPITQLTIEIVQYLLSKIVKPKYLPKMDFYNGVPKEQTTMVIIPTIIKSGEKVKDLISKLEVFYLANKSENIYFTLVGDATSSSKEVEEYDKEIEKVGIEEIDKLNNKYKKDGMPIFNFIYRKRVWSQTEQCYLGWERKRGLIAEFNEYLKEDVKNKFAVNTLEDYKKNGDLPNIKYIITLDADTNLILNSGFELIGAAAHILNTPILNKNKDSVVDGHALIQPRVGIDLISCRKSVFAQIFAGAGGIDSYTNAISDIYEDNFDEGIFTGKGIYDLDVFYNILKNEIPTNTVLSHDLLEGNYLRCGLASDILLLDGYPYKYNAYISRLHRWIRGDWQIARWIRNKIKVDNNKIKKNPFGILSKYKILDNLRRSLVEIFILLTIILSIVSKINTWPIVSLMLTISILPFILELLNYIISKESNGTGQKYFVQVITGIKAIGLRAIISLAFIPHKAYISLNAIIKTIYRMNISKQHLLEWTTAEEAELNGKTTLISYYKLMISNVIIGVLGILLTLNNFNILFILLCILWIIAPVIAWYISKEKIEKSKVKELNDKEINYVLDIGKRTWEFFNTYINKENNYLPPDNYQEDRINEIVDRTSSTNIGLGLLSVIAAYDLGYIEFEYLLDMINNMMNTIINLPKWNGHLYNWYNIRTLKPLLPRFISTVDSGNFIGYLYVLKQFFKNVLENKISDKIEQISNIIKEIDKIIENTDFSILYDKEKRVFSIGFNVEENKLTDSYYDLLASEARQASLVAIAKKDIPSKHWQNLSRTLTIMNKYKGLVSWSGTAFEYLMPNINIKKYPGSLLDESCKFMIMSQKEYSKKLGIPWGISESAFNLKDLNSNYQYKAFGIPWLGLKRGLEEDIVVSSYGSILAIPDIPKEVIKNLQLLQKEGMYSKYGFYEAIDYTPGRIEKDKKSAPVKTYMAHHQGLILLSIDNLINNNIIQERFMQNPEIKSVDILLQERMPEDVILAKEKKEKVEKLKNIDYENYTERIYTKLNDNLNNFNVIANDDYTICINERGEGYSKYKDIQINRFKETNDNPQGILFYIKNIRTKKIWTSGYLKDDLKPDKYEVHFLPDMDKYIRQDENIVTKTKIITVPNASVEIRSVELKNIGNIEEVLEVTSLFEPVLSKKEQDYSHMAFNKLFLKYEFEEKSNSILIERNKRGNIEPIYLGVNFSTDGETIGDLEYEIDEETLNNGNGIGIPKMIENSVPFSKKLGLTVNPVVAQKRTVKIKPNEKIVLNLVIAISENSKDVLDNVIKYTNNENVERAFELSKARVEEEARYLGIKGKDIETYQKMLSYLIVHNPMKSMYLKKIKNKVYKQSDIWKYGISGDLPIILLKIKDANDVYVVKDILKAYDYFRTKNINIDLVILNQEENVYERYVKEAIEREILNRHLGYMINSYGGIYILNENEIEDKEVLEFLASIIVDAHHGNIKNIIKDLEEDYLNTIKSIPEENAKNIVTPNLEKKGNLIEFEKLKYYNEYGAFSEDGKEYIIKINKNNKLPTVWSHIMANEKFGTVVTQNMGGFTWKNNSRLSRITSWSNNSVLDTPSEIIYIKDKDYGKSWSLNANLDRDDDEYYITYGFGYAKYTSMKLGLLQETKVFVPINESIKINLIRLKNTLPEKRNLKLIYYIKPVLGEDELKTNGYIDIKYDDNANIIYSKSIYSTDIENINCYISSSQKMESYTGNKNSFIGNGNILEPEAINKVRLDNEDGLGKSNCIAIEINIDLKAYEEKEISIILGSEENKEISKEVAYKYTKIEECKKELENVKEYWNNKLRKLYVKTPVESMNIMLNGWLVYQTIVSRLWAKSAFYQSGGAIGFRDQLQDTLGLKYIDTNIMKNQILINAQHQFIEGDVEHWWHKETSRGIRTRFSDDFLWLPYVTAEYINFTGDNEILENMLPYIYGEKLQEGQDEIYDIHSKSDIEESLYMHCIRAIDNGINIGEKGLPKIGSGDWNDGFSTVGNKGKGESVWLGFFLYEVLNRFIPICEQKQDKERVEKYKNIRQELKRVLNTVAWDGRWYKRAFMDDGRTLGSIENEECKIDSISQSWAVISNAGDNDKKYIAMESLENYLVDKNNGLIKLLDPPFDKSDLEPGYIKAYLPGVRENGGQYTHASIWAIIAVALLGLKDKAVEYFKIINPIEHSRTKEAANKYKVEPYVVAADIYGAENLVGRGGWTWYTGSSSWMYKAGIEYILGLKIENQILTINPCIPEEWKEYQIRYEYGTSIYNIKVKNNNPNNPGIDKFIVNGEQIEEKQIKLIDNGKIYEIEVIM